MREVHAGDAVSSLIFNLGRLPDTDSVALLLRHSAREEIPAGEIGNDIPITEIGKDVASSLGRFLGGRLKGLHSSPLLRCVQTAEALRDGAGAYLEISTHRFLGDPGVFVLDGKVAWGNWKNLGNEGVAHHLASTDQALPGMAHPQEAVQMLLEYMLATVRGVPGIHVFVTHDVILAPVVARLLSCPSDILEWPAFLEGALFWLSQTGTHLLYREWERRVG